MHEDKTQPENTCPCCSDGAIQFAMIEDNLGKKICLSACEVAVLNEPNSFELVPGRVGHRDVIAYGALLTSEGGSIEDACEELEKCKGYAFLSFDYENKKAYLSELVDFEFGGPLENFKTKIPVAAHLRTTIEIPLRGDNKDNYAKVFTLWYEAQKPEEVILSRRSLLAFISRDELGVDNWKSRLDEVFLQRVGKSVGVLAIE